MTKKGIVLVSGGIDSAVTAAIAKNEGYELYFLTVNYGQKNFEKELEYSKKFAKYFNVKEHKIISMDWLGELGISGITDAKVNFDGINKNLEYVPFRNTCMISAAVAWAEVIMADCIFTGSMAGPWICPDNTPDYYEKFQQLISTAVKFDKDLKICAPLNYCDKPAIIKKAIELNIPLEYTWTCVGRGDAACGICPPCKNRLASFKEVGIKDPIKYVDGYNNE